MHRGKLIALVIGGIVVAILGAYVAFPLIQDAPSATNLIQPTRTILVDTVPLSVAVADSPEERMQGLSGITELPLGQGLLFVFEEDRQHSFWMKDMLFSIDMLWIAADGRVVHIAPSVSPDTFPQSFTSPLPARYVLEVPAGFAAEHEITVGSKVEL